MKILIVGLGVQGKKRKKLLNKKYLYATVDIRNKNANFSKIENAPLKNYDTVFACVPDSEKLKIINYCLKNKKNILVEKPLIIGSDKKIKKIQQKAKKLGVIVYTAYNHRFEPNFVNIRKIIKSKKLGKIYYCHIFYGNGTAKLVKKNKWRDIGLGVVQDLGTHLIDTIKFWFDRDIKFKLIANNKFENKAPDHAVLLSKKKNFLLSWKCQCVCGKIL